MLPAPQTIDENNCAGFHPGRSGEGFTPPQWSTPCVKSEGHLEISQNIGTPNNNQLLILLNHLGPRKLYEDLL